MGGVGGAWWLGEGPRPPLQALRPCTTQTQSGILLPCIQSQGQRVPLEPSAGLQGPGVAQAGGIAGGLPGGRGCYPRWWRASSQARLGVLGLTLPGRTTRISRLRAGRVVQGHAAEQLGSLWVGGGGVLPPPASCVLWSPWTGPRPTAHSFSYSVSTSTATCRSPQGRKTHKGPSEETPDPQTTCLSPCSSSVDHGPSGQPAGRWIQNWALGSQGQSTSSSECPGSLLPAGRRLVPAPCPCVQAQACRKPLRGSPPTPPRLGQDKGKASGEVGERPALRSGPQKLEVSCRTRYGEGPGLLPSIRDRALRSGVRPGPRVPCGLPCSCLPSLLSGYGGADPGFTAVWAECVAVATACLANFPLGFGFRGSAWPSLNFYPLWLRREHLQLPRPLAGEAAGPEGSGGSWMDLSSAGTRSSPPPPLSGQFCQSQEVWQFIAADVACPRC